MPAMKLERRAFSLRQSITPGVSARLITRFSAPVSEGTSVKCWYTMPTPSALASRGLRTVTGWPSIARLPSSGW